MKFLSKIIFRILIIAGCVLYIFCIWHGILEFKMFSAVLVFIAIYIGTMNSIQLCSYINQINHGQQEPDDYYVTDLIQIPADYDQTHSYGQIHLTQTEQMKLRDVAAKWNQYTKGNNH